jgi:hypothetical protein
MVFTSPELTHLTIVDLDRFLIEFALGSALVCVYYGIISLDWRIFYDLW